MSLSQALADNQYAYATSRVFLNGSLPRMMKIARYYGDNSVLPELISVQPIQSVAAQVEFLKTSYKAPSSEDEIPEIEFIRESRAMTTRPYRLGCLWSELTPEDYADFMDGMFLSWMHRLGLEDDRPQRVFDLTACPPGVPYFDHKQTFVDDFIGAGCLIFRKTRFTGANFILAGSQTMGIIEVLPGFVSKAYNPARATYEAGVLNGTWSVIRTDAIPKNDFVVGASPQSSIPAAGILFSPHVCVLLENPVLSAGKPDFEPSTTLAKIVINADVYVTGTIKTKESEIDGDAYKSSV